MTISPCLRVYYSRFPRSKCGALFMLLVRRILGLPFPSQFLIRSIRLHSAQQKESPSTEFSGLNKSMSSRAQIRMKHDGPARKSNREAGQVCEPLRLSLISHITAFPFHRTVSWSKERKTNSPRFTDLPTPFAVVSDLCSRHRD